MLSNLNNLKEKLQNKDSGDEVTSLYYLIKELGCLPDIIGREYEVVYEGNKIVKIIQKPIPITTLQVLIQELNEDNKRQEKEMKKSQRRGKK
jgi:hypothetical protein